MYVNLSQLAFAAYIYDALTADDKSLTKLMDQTGPIPDLTRQDTVVAILEWLNSWGCRLRKDDFGKAADELADWQNACGSQLPPTEANLLDLSDGELELAASAYANLFERKADRKKRFQATATAKALFVLRPNALPPWDEAIRKGPSKDKGSKMRYDGSRESYLQFLKDSQSELRELKQSCEAVGLDCADVPDLIERPFSSLAKLVDEYNWVTITRGFEPPDCLKLSQWLGWTSDIPARLKSALEALPKVKQKVVGKA